MKPVNELLMYFKGISLNNIPRLLLRQYGIFITNVSVYHLVSHFSKLVVDEAGNTRIDVGDIWITVGTVIRKSGKETSLSLIDVLDVDTQFLLASKVSDYGASPITQAGSIQTKGYTVIQSSQITISCNNYYLTFRFSPGGRAAGFGGI